MTQRIRSLLARQLLARSTGRYVAAGWPVLPGAWWDGHRYRCPELTCRTTGLHPAHQSASADPAVARAWWAAHPYTVLLPTGNAVDVLAVPGWAGRRVWRRLHLRGVPVPAASLPGGDWLLFTAPSPAAPPADDVATRVVHHGAGSWVPVPPSALDRGPVRWEHAPWVGDWTLPRSEVVLAALATQRPRTIPRTAPNRRRSPCQLPDPIPPL